jgi:hypothetical protein
MMNWGEQSPLTGDENMAHELVEQLAMINFYKTSSRETFKKFIQDLEGLERTGMISLVPLSNLSRLMEFGYFETKDRQEWAKNTVAFLKSIDTILLQ